MKTKWIYWRCLENQHWSYDKKYIIVDSISKIHEKHNFPLKLKTWKLILLKHNLFTQISGQRDEKATIVIIPNRG
jgi:hypothetical protein